MNLSTLNISVTPCVVCDYAFSDKHHIWPQAKGGKSLPTILLCPNHHRFANLIQAMLLRGMEREQIEAFAQKYFDTAFNATALALLITEQERLGAYGWAAYSAQKEREARSDPQTALSTAEVFVREQFARLAHMHPDELIPMADYQEALAHIGAVNVALDFLDSLGVSTYRITQPQSSSAMVSQAEYRWALEQIESLLLLVDREALLDSIAFMLEQCPEDMRSQAAPAFDLLRTIARTLA